MAYTTARSSYLTSCAHCFSWSISGMLFPCNSTEYQERHQRKVSEALVNDWWNVPISNDPLGYKQTESVAPKIPVTVMPTNELPVTGL